MKVLHSTVNLVPFSPIRNAKKLELQLRLEHVFRKSLFMFERTCNRSSIDSKLMLVSNESLSTQTVTRFYISDTRHTNLSRWQLET